MNKQNEIVIWYDLLFRMTNA
uniref:Uncharacterized protein n=1 Tax=Anguilla anguilla TaxID=7936 RepID=A0A0E9VVY2_ANGAN